MRTLVWALSSMNTTMSSETGRVREPLSTPYVLALMRLLACVSADVNGQRTPLDETLAASWCHTGVWPLICVDPIVSLKVRFSIETFIAGLPVTLEGACIRLVLYQFHDVHSVPFANLDAPSGQVQGEELSTVTKIMEVERCVE